MKKILTFLFILPLIGGVIFASELDVGLWVELQNAIESSTKLLEQQLSQTGSLQNQITQTTWALDNAIIAYIENDDDLISSLHEKGLTIHKTRSDFKPEKNIRRDEAAKMLTLALVHLPQPASFVQKLECSFSDLDKARSDLRPIILQSCKKGLFKWSNGDFNPEYSITNGQLMTVLGRMLFGMQQETVGHYATPYVKLLNQKGYLTGTNLTRVATRDQPAKRGMLAQLLGKVLTK